MAREAAHFRCPGAGRKGRIDPVDVEREVRRTGRHATDFGDDPRNATVPHLIDVDHGDAVLPVELEVLFTVHRTADAHLDESPPVDQPFLDRPPKRCPVKILSAEILVPRVDMRVDLYECERPVPLRQRAQDRQRDRMVATDDNRAGTGVGNRGDSRLDGVVAFLDADRRRVDVADVGDVQAIEWGDLLKVAVTADPRRLAANLARAQPGARPVRGAAVVRHADDGDVESAWILDMRQPHERRRLREPRRLEGSAWLVRHRRDSTSDRPRKRENTKSIVFRAFVVSWLSWTAWESRQGC